MKINIDIAGIGAAVIVLGTVGIVGASFGLLVLIFIRSISSWSTNCDVVGAAMSETEIGVFMLLGAIVWIIIFLRELGKGNIQ